MTPDQQALRDVLAAAPARAVAATQASAVPPDAAPAPGEWSAREVLLHLTAVEEEVWHVRLDALAREDFPHWPWTEPGLWSGPDDATFGGALAVFDARRAATVARLDALDAVGWLRQGRHDTFGVLDVEALMRIARDHDEEHLAQLSSGDT